MFSIKRRYLYIFLLGTYSFLNIKFTEGDSLLPSPVNDIVFYAIIFFTVQFIWEGNHLLEKWVTRWSHNKLSTRLIRQFVTSVFIILIISLVVSFIIQLAFSISLTALSFKLMLGFTFRVNLFLHCINAIVVYNRELSGSKLEAEQFKKETTEAQLEALRKQVNPHFLFNSFNVLSSLIEADSPAAVLFVEQLSSVYRYLLNTQDQKLVTLKEELAFIESYLFLLKTRFGKNLLVEINLDNKEHEHIPPSTLQLLVENAIKHNEISKRKSLQISIYRESDLIIVENNLNPKATTEASSQLGLQNIISRYKLMNEGIPEIENGEEKFIVRIPVITKNPNEGIGH